MNTIRDKVYMTRELLLITRGGVMQKLFLILLVGLAFLALNVGTVAAQTGMLPTADDSARPIGEGGEGGGPAAQDMSGNMINDGGHGANSGKALEAEKAKVLTKAQAINACLSFHGANDDFTKQMCGDSYNECLSDSFRQKQGAASACDKMHGSPLK